MKMIDNRGNVVSAVTLPAGDAETPSLRFTGDTNTGLFSTDPDRLGLTTGGSERVTITGEGHSTLRKRLQFQQLVVEINGDISDADWGFSCVKLVPHSGFASSFNLNGIILLTSAAAIRSVRL